MKETEDAEHVCDCADDGQEELRADEGLGMDLLWRFRCSSVVSLSLPCHGGVVVIFR